MVCLQHFLYEVVIKLLVENNQFYQLHQVGRHRNHTNRLCCFWNTFFLLACFWSAGLCHGCFFVFGIYPFSRAQCNDLSLPQSPLGSHCSFYKESCSVALLSCTLLFSRGLQSLSDFWMFLSCSWQNCKIITEPSTNHWCGRFCCLHSPICVLAVSSVPCLERLKTIGR